MLVRLLKKDLKRKKTMNLILLAFIITATIFLAGSVSNLKIIANAIPNFLDKAKVADLTVFMNNSPDITSKMENLLSSTKNIQSYGQSTSSMLLQNNFYYLHDNKEEKLKDVYYISVQDQNSPYQLVFDENDQFFQLQDGEIALPYSAKSNNNLKLGDTIRIRLGEFEKDYKLVLFTKDAMLGTQMVGIQRFFLSDHDYAELEKQTNAQPTIIYYITSSHVSEFMKEFRDSNINYFMTLERSQAALVYLMELLIARILIIVSLCLIGISFLILRFTIVFTVQEDYQQIGVMKTIGIKNRKIQKLYLLKYLALAIAGSTIGFGLSFPLCDLLTKQVLTTLIIPNASSQIGLSLLFSALFSLY